mgnify:CR=1 FL=1
MPLVQLVNGKAVVVKMQAVSTNNAVDKIKNMMGNSVVQSKDGKMSSLDFKNREATDRWSKEDTNKFYCALQLMGTDFSLIETLFEGKRTRTQIKVSGWLALSQYIF